MCSRGSSTALCERTLQGQHQRSIGPNQSVHTVLLGLEGATSQIREHKGLLSNWWKPRSQAAALSSHHSSMLMASSQTVIHGHLPQPRVNK